MLRSAAIIFPSMSFCSIDRFGVDSCIGASKSDNGLGGSVVISCFNFSTLPECGKTGKDCLCSTFDSASMSASRLILFCRDRRATPIKGGGKRVPGEGGAFHTDRKPLYTREGEEFA